MCTAFVKKGNDLICGFNLDIDPEQWNFAVYKRKDIFTVGIKVGSTLYYTHGVNSSGHFSNVPYMNGNTDTIKAAKPERIDLITDRYLRNKYSFSDVMDILENKAVVNAKFTSLHTLMCDREGNIVIIEPENGFETVKEDYAVITNFPVLCRLSDYSSPFYGKDRYDIVNAVLAKSSDDFNARDALLLLDKVKQTGKWGTRVSFVYSRNENAVYFCMNGDFDNVQKHCFEK